LEFFADGNFNPSPDDVAAASGVSLRSVYRYVSSREALIELAIERQLEKVASMWTVELVTSGDLGYRLDHFIEHRLRLYDAVAATNRATRALAREIPSLEARINQGRVILRRQFERQFAEELSSMEPQRRRAVIALAQTSTTIEGLDILIEHQGLSIRDAREALYINLYLLLTEKEPS
jgi:AcrR family transcriptional regulator